VHVAAKDLATGKAQSIKIEVSSGLSEAEINRMVNDAEKFADDDKRKGELIQERNEADQLAYATEKTLKEYGDKVSSDDRQAIETALEKLKSVSSGDNVQAIKSAREELMKVSHKLAEHMYKAAAEQQGSAKAQPEPETAGSGQPGTAESSGSGAVDADFEVVDGDKK
jgi:molecular chaperone DnaK